MSLLPKLRWNACWLMALLCIGWALAACGAKEPLKEFDPDDTGAIYSAVIRQIYVKDDTFGGTLQPPTLYIIRHTSDKAGSPMGESGELVLLAESCNPKLRRPCKTCPRRSYGWMPLRRWRWMPRLAVWSMGGAIITLGNLYPQADGSVQVSGSIYVASLGAGGQTYVLTQIDGVWEITGTTGGRWIS